MADPARVEEIFNQALVWGEVAARAEYLNEVCGEDRELRERVEALLAAHDASGDFMKLPDAEHTGEGARITLREGPGSKIGRYKLLQQIGEGGFGVVFVAEQESPVRRMVALKIIKLGMDTRRVVARFEAERQALAMMDHPSVAKVFDGGATETGRPYFVMELVKGIPITEYCDKNKLSIRQRLELFAQVCQAVQHAHQKGLIHRDIKPSNILVATADDRPVAKVIDFGIAKATGARLTEKTLFTEFKQLIGTPEYMSPEQAEGGMDIDTRSDVYSLGVLLYELLAGSPPFDPIELRSKAFAEMQRIIREVEPPAPSTRLSTMKHTLPSVAAQRGIEPRKLTAMVHGELDWIVMRCLEKDRMRRYESANGLAMDVQRYLAGEPVLAAPPSAVYRIRKFARRHRTPVMATALLAIAALVGTGAYVRAIRSEQKRTDSALQVAKVERGRAEDAQRTAEQARLGTEIELQRARLLQVQLELATGDMTKARSLLLQPVHPSLEQEWHWRAWEYARKSRVLRRVDLNPSGGPLQTARTGATGSLRIIDGHLVAQVAPPPRFASQDWVPSKPLAVDVDTGLARPLMAPPEHRNENPAPSGAFVARSSSPDGRYVASSGDRGIVEIRDTQNQGALDNIPGAGEDVVALIFDPDGRRLHGLSGDWFATTWRWSAAGATGAPDVDAADTKAQQARRLRFTPDGRFLTSGCYGDVVQVWDAKTHQIIREIKANIGGSSRPDREGDAWLTADGQTLLTAGWKDQIIRAWRVSDGSPAREIKTDPWTGEGAIRLICKSDGKTLYATGGSNTQGRLELWNADAGTKIRGIAKLADGAWVSSIALLEKQNRLFVCLHPADMVSDSPQQRRCLILDATTLETVGMLPDAHTGGLRDVDISPDGKLLALCSRDGTATIWDWQNERLLHRLVAKAGRAHSNIISSIHFHPTEPVVATACHDNHVIFWSTDTGRPLADLNVDERNKLGYGAMGILKDIAFSPDGRTMVITVKDKIWWLDLSAYDEGVANVKADRDRPPRPATRDPANVAWEEGMARYRRAVAHREAGRLKEAITEYSRAIELAPEHAESWDQRAWVYLMLGQPEKALPDTHKALELNQTNEWMWHTRAWAYKDLKQYEKAIADYTKAIELKPSEAHFWVARAECWSALGQADKAAADRAKASSLQSPVQKADSASALAWKHLNAGRLQDAVTEYTKAIEQKPDDGGAWRGRGQAYISLGQPEKALPDETKAIELDPKNVWSWHHRAWAYRTLKQYDKAIADYTKAIEIQPTNAQFRFARAECFAGLGQADKASEERAAAIAISSKCVDDHPDDAHAHNQLAWILATHVDVKLRNPKRAVELAEKGVKLDPNGGYVWNTLGVARYYAGDYTQAISDLEKAMALRNGGGSEDFFFLAMAHQRLGNRDQARLWFDKAVEWMDKNAPKNPELLRFRAEAAELLGIAEPQPATNPTTRP